MRAPSLTWRCSFRANNILKGAWSLGEGNHWELASSLVRQLFELVVNIEWMGRQSDRDSEVVRFAAYGAMQQLLYRIETMSYDETTGRPIDESARARYKEQLDTPVIAQFKDKPRADGSTRWAASWNRRSVKAMTDESPQPIRKYQYSLLYRRWSEETHGAPGALIESILRDGGDPHWMDSVVEDDLRETAQVLSMGVGLFSELWMLLPGAPEFDERWPRWFEQLRAWTWREFEMPSTSPPGPRSSST